jgi:outer membrane murein-binding lipoprotein Lpp
MKIFGMCINWKVLVGVSAVAAGLFVFVPKVAGAALPFLILAICPLSMLLMAGAMFRMNKGSAENTLNREAKLAHLKTQQRELANKIAALEQTDDKGFDRTPQPS